MKGKIDNRFAFDLYVLIHFGFFISFFGYILIRFWGLQTGNKEIFHLNVFFMIIWVVVGLILTIIDFLIKPAYFEGVINFGEISIKSFNPTKSKNGLKYFLMLFYRNYLIEHKINRQSFNNYRILIENFGLKKSLILQKIENGKLYESNPINISFLGARKYTDLLLSIDRLKEKISLN